MTDSNDFYDDDLPEIYIPWSQVWQNNKDALKLLSLAVLAPATVSVLCFAVAHHVGKKIGSS